MAWQIEFSDDADRDFAKLDKSIQRRIFHYLHDRIATAADPRDFGKPLLHELAGFGAIASETTASCVASKSRS